LPSRRVAPRIGGLGGTMPPWSGPRDRLPVAPIDGKGTP